MAAIGYWGQRTRRWALAIVVAPFIFVCHALGAETQISTDAFASACAPPHASSRLPELTYECLALRGKQHVLVGKGGVPGGEAVLLIHGLGNNAHLDWRNVIPSLAERFRVLTLDLPGFGSSAPLPEGYSFDILAAVLVELLRRESIERAHVVGHSLGGALSLYFAHTYPQRTQRLVLVDAAGMLLKSVYVHHVSKLTTPELGIAPVDRVLDVFDNRINGLNRHIAYRLESTFDFSAWLADHPSVRVALLGRFTQADAALGLIEHDFTRAIRETQVPTTIIWGRNDDVSPLRVGELLAGRLSDARLHVIERTGHVPMNEREEFMQLLMPALTDPLTSTSGPQAWNEPVDVRCSGEADQRYSGRLATVTLENCRDVRIENAQLDKLTIKNSSVVLNGVSIAGGDLAVEVSNSFVTATVLDITASGIALSVDDSQLDLAGASIRGGKQGVRMVTPSRIYFSISDMRAPDYTGDLHRIWD
jgi:pimeloyl-ACP methyl ester carboxylesterase